MTILGYEGEDAYIDTLETRSSYFQKEKCEINELAMRCEENGICSVMNYNERAHPLAHESLLTFRRALRKTTTPLNKQEKIRNNLPKCALIVGLCVSSIVL